MCCNFQAFGNALHELPLVVLRESQRAATGLGGRVHRAGSPQKAAALLVFGYPDYWIEQELRDTCLSE